MDSRPPMLEPSESSSGYDEMSQVELQYQLRSRDKEVMRLRQRLRENRVIEIMQIRRLLLETRQDEIVRLRQRVAELERRRIRNEYEGFWRDLCASFRLVVKYLCR